MAKPRILAAFPTYDGWRANGGAMFQLGRMPYDITPMEFRSSLLAKGMNIALATGLNGKFTHLLLVHADIKPVDPKWFDQLYREFVRVGADVLSVISPIKDNDKATSTALDGPDKWLPERILLDDAINHRPETWTAPNLLVNTGLVLMNLGDWAKRVYFTINDRLYTNDGRLQVGTEPEDWFFSRRARDAGASLWVTRKIRIRHEGTRDWTNF